jgi:hypothetical protein
MKIKHPWDLLPEELPHVESPFFALSKFDDAQRRGEPVAIDRWGSFMPMGGAEQIRRQLESGSLLLVCGAFQPPFSPIVRWRTGGGSVDNGRWEFHRDSALSGRLHGQLEVLNRSDYRPPGCAGSGSAPPPEVKAGNVPLSALALADLNETDAPQSQPRTGTLQIGVFFDGTRNHKDNDRHLPGRDVTNIAKLYELYPDEQSRQVRSLYIHGVGTIDGKHTEQGFATFC